MGARTVQINYNTRPVRLAFLVHKPDPTILEKVFTLNMTLWGGSLNPIVVLDGSTRKQLGPHYAYEDSTYEQEQLWLLKAFDPDILVNYGGIQVPDYLAPFKERTFPVDVMRWDPFGTGETSAFLEVWPFLEQHWRKEVRFLSKPQEKYGYIDLEYPAELRTFLAARFGSYPKESNGDMVLASNFGGKLVTYHEDFRKSFSLDEWVFPARITTLQMDIPGPSTMGNYILFLLDAENMFDIVDYWNLRAAGFRVFPLPTSHYRDFSESAKSFAERSIYPINRTVSTMAEMVKAFQTTGLGLTDVTGLSAFTAVLSNLISNVPAVMLLTPLVSVQGSNGLWLALAVSSTLAGNATILGAAANVIVVETSERLGVEVSFWRFIKAGLPITLLTLLVSIVLLVIIG